MKRFHRAALAALLLATSPVLADSHSSEMKKPMTHGEKTIAIDGAWARASAPGQKNGAAYMMLTNHAKADDKLVAAASPVAGRVELHTHLNDGGVMRMRKIDAVALPAGGHAELKPGGDHVMLMGLKAPLKVGEHIHLTLTFASGAETTLDVMVMKSAKAAGMKEMKHGQ